MCYLSLSRNESFHFAEFSLQTFKIKIPSQNSILKLRLSYSPLNDCDKFLFFIEMESQFRVNCRY